jgi:hypothetical protein
MDKIVNAVGAVGSGPWADADDGGHCYGGSEQGWPRFHRAASCRHHQRVEAGSATLAHDDDPKGFHTPVATGEFHSILDPKVPDRGHHGDIRHLGVPPMPPQDFGDLRPIDALMSDKHHHRATALGYAGDCNGMPPMVPPRPAITDIPQCPAQSADCGTKTFRRVMERQGGEADRCGIFGGP